MPSFKKERLDGSSVGYLASGETPCYAEIAESSLKMYYVYIIESLVDGDFYKGSTNNYAKRLEEHNGGKSKFTSSKMPWKLIYVEAFETRKESLIKEKKLKRCNKEYLKWLITQPGNILNNK